MKCNTGCRYIDTYLNPILAGEVRASKDMVKAARLCVQKLSDPDVEIRIGQIEKAKELIERYFDMELLDWELFVLSVVHCFYRSTDGVVFAEYLLMMGRGNGKNGFISSISWYFTTQYHGINGYNVDIIANSEDQAKTSFDDIYQMLDRTWKNSKRFFYRSKEQIRNLVTGSYIKYNTSNARTKDGKRSACLIFDEIHEYQNGESLRVFRSGFGKRKHSRIFYITTNGYIREGVLDDRLQIAKNVLNGELPQSRMLPLLYHLDSDEEAEDPDNWVKANPSLPYFPTLREQIETDNIERQFDRYVRLDFFTKRMNRPRSDKEIVVTEWENIESTKEELPDLRGWSCVVGIDYASLRDWASVNLHFRDGDKRLDINHAWLTTKSEDLDRIKAPWKEWAEDGKITVVDDEVISPYLLTDYIVEMAEYYSIVAVSIDDYRYPLMEQALMEIGFAESLGNLKLTRPNTVMRIQPVIEYCFVNHFYIWGDAPHLRWATNNTKLVRSSRKQGADTGNFFYAKIEAKSRKNDPFMALVASMTIEDLLGYGGNEELPNMGLIT